MGAKQNIDYESFPNQGTFLGRRCRVCFKYDTSHVLLGTIVRDDNEQPGIGIIRLDDGRHVLFSECQYSPFNVVAQS